MYLNMIWFIDAQQNDEYRDKRKRKKFDQDQSTCQ